MKDFELLFNIFDYTYMSVVFLYLLILFHLQFHRLFFQINVIGILLLQM